MEDLLLPAVSYPTSLAGGCAKILSAPAGFLFLPPKREHALRGIFFFGTKIYFDGACEPINPGGTASYGWLVKRGDKIVAKGSGIVGSGNGMTNNVAEYMALIEAFQYYIKIEY